MNDSKNRIPLQISRKVVTVPIRYELTNHILENLKIDLLQFIEDHKDASAVVFDLNGVKILDADNFEDLKKVMQMIEIMGLRVMLCGLAPGIVSAIIDMEIDVSNINTTLDLNEALEELNV